MKLTPENIKKGIRFLKHYGWKEFKIRLKEKSESSEIPYNGWWEAHKPSEEELKYQREAADRWKTEKPLFSILVPCFKTPEAFLRDMLDSVLNQSYDNWELCLVDASPAEDALTWSVLEEYAKRDSRIHIKRLVQNSGISENTNQAYEMASGDYIALLDHDDLLAPNALFEMAKTTCHKQHKGEIAQSGVHWNRNLLFEKGSEPEWNFEKAPGLLYSDEDKVTEDLSEHYAPHFKPDFSPDLLRSNNYITHFTALNRKLLEEMLVSESDGDGKLFHKEMDGAQDYDLIIRTAEFCLRNNKAILHIPKILYHWRMHQNSTASNQASKSYAFDAGVKVIQKHLQRTNLSGRVEALEPEKHAGFYRVHYDCKEKPLISIIIPNKDEKESLEKCLNSIWKSSYSNYEIIIVENNSQSSEIFEYYRILEQEHSNIKVVTWESHGVFNYSAINNFGVGFASGTYLLLLNNDIEIISKDWLEELVSVCSRPEVAIVGARLYYPDDSIQHAGIVIGVGGHSRGVATNMLVGTRRITDGYLHKAGILLNYSSVTAACMMVKKSVFDQVYGFTEKLTVAFNDVDLCLKIRKLGYYVVYDPYVEAYHYESKSRGQEDSPEKVARFGEEIEYMRTEWNDILRYGDPFYNPNFTHIRNDYSLDS